MAESFEGLRIVFCGTKGEIKEETEKHQHHSSMLIEAQLEKYLFDFGKKHGGGFLEDVKPSTIFITHPDHARGLHSDIEVPVYAHPRVASKLRERGIEAKELPFRSETMSVQAIPIEHSISAFSTALLIEFPHYRMLYAPNFLGFKSKAEEKRVLKAIDMWIADASSPYRTIRRTRNGEAFGHLSMRKQIELAEQYDVPTVVFTHFGKRSLRLDPQEFASDEVEVIFAEDGQAVTLCDADSENGPGNLLEPLFGILVRHPMGSGHFALQVAQMLLPKLSDEKGYVEPFAGGASVFFTLRRHGFKGPAILNDKSPTYYLALKGLKERKIREFKSAYDEVKGLVARIPEGQVTKSFPFPKPTSIKNAFIRVLMVKGSYMGLAGSLTRLKLSSWDWKDFEKDFHQYADWMKGAEVRQGDALELMKRLGSRERVVMYIDPPWVEIESEAKRSGFWKGPSFDWREFLKAVRGLKCPFVLSIGRGMRGGIPRKSLSFLRAHKIRRANPERDRAIRPRGQDLYSNFSLDNKTEFDFDIKTFNPEEHSVKELREKWRLANAWWATLEKKKSLRFSKQEVLDFAKRIFLALVEESSTTFSPENKTAEELIRSILEATVSTAMYLPAPHSELLASGKKTAVVKARNFKAPVSNFVKFCDRNRVYGFVRLEEPEPIDVEEFQRLAEQHRITDEERYAWWPSAKKLWYYPVREVINLSQPRKIRLPKGAQTFVSLDDLQPAFATLPIVSTTELKIASPIELLILHARSHAAYFDKPEKALELHSRVVSEMVKRGMEHRYETEMDRRSFSLEYASLQDFLASLPETVVTEPDKVLLVGSTIVSGFGHDVDLLQRVYRDPRFEFRLLRALPPELASRIQILDADEGGYSARATLYDKGYIKRDLTYAAELSFALKEEAKREALQSRKENRIEPFRFFAMQKTYAGYHKREYFDVKEAQQMLAIAPFPWVAEKKADGMHCQFSKVGERIEVYSEDGGKLSLDQMKDLVEALKKMPHDFVIAAELEAWLPEEVARNKGMAQEAHKKGRFYHLGRAVTTGYIHSKRYDPDIAKHLVLNVYDLLWLDGEDIHKLPLSERMKRRDRIFPKVAGPGVMVGHIWYEVMDSPDDLVRIWKRIHKEGYTEGLMLKPLSEPYLPWYTGGKWLKLKTLYELTCRIAAIKQSKEHATGESLGVWRYFCVIKGPKGPIPCGWTYAAKQRFKEGDLIEVRFQNLNKYIDPKFGAWLNWWRPTLVGARKEKNEPDTLEIANRLVLASKGEIKEKPLPTEYKQILSKLGVGFTLEELVESSDDIDELFAPDFSVYHAEKLPPLPKEVREFIEKWQLSEEQVKKTPLSKFPRGFFVLQLHPRGKSIHLDLRRKEDGHLVGFTILNQVEGAIKEDIDTLEELHNLSRKILRGDESLTKFYPNMPPGKNVQSVMKARQPLDWLKQVETVVEPGGVGATRFKPGLFDLLDCGIMKKGMEKPWARDYYIYGRHFKGRISFRALTTQEKYTKAGKAPFFWICRFVKPETPPYVFTAAQRKKRDYVPTESTLPYELETVIPSELRWWEKPLSRKERLRRIDQAYNYLIEKGIISGRKMQASLDKEDSASKNTTERRFVLHRLWWRGQIVVRGMPVIHWRLRWEDGGKARQFVFQKNPLVEESLFAGLKPLDYAPPKGESPHDWFDFSGKIPPGHPENKLKREEVNVEILDEGKVNIVEDSEEFISFEFKGKALKGYYIAKREQPGSSIWLLRRSEKPGEHLEEVSDE